MLDTCQPPFLPKVFALILPRLKCPKVNSLCTNFTHKMSPLSEFPALAKGSPKPPEAQLRNTGCPGFHFLSQSHPHPINPRGLTRSTSYWFLKATLPSTLTPPPHSFVRLSFLLIWSFPMLCLPVSSLKA